MACRLSVRLHASGGGRSQQRTRLSRQFPAKQGKYREFGGFQPYRQPPNASICFGYRPLQWNSLRTGTGNFPVPIRELALSNRDRSEPLTPAVTRRSVSDALKLFLQASLLEDRIGSVSGLDAAIDREVLIARRTVPYFMVTLALAVKSAPVFPQYLLQIAAEVCHVSGRVQG